MPLFVKNSVNPSGQCPNAVIFNICEKFVEIQGYGVILEANHPPGHRKHIFGIALLLLELTTEKFVAFLQPWGWMAVDHVPQA